MHLCNLRTRGYTPTAEDESVQARTSGQENTFYGIWKFETCLFTDKARFRLCEWDRWILCGGREDDIENFIASIFLVVDQFAWVMVRDPVVLMNHTMAATRYLDRVIKPIIIYNRATIYFIDDNGQTHSAKFVNDCLEKHEFKKNLWLPCSYKLR